MTPGPDACESPSRTSRPAAARIAASIGLAPRSAGGQRPSHRATPTQHSACRRPPADQDRRRGVSHQAPARAHRERQRADRGDAPSHSSPRSQSTSGPCHSRPAAARASPSCRRPRRDQPVLDRPPGDDPRRQRAGDEQDARGEEPAVHGHNRWTRSTSRSSSSSTTTAFGASEPAATASSSPPGGHGTSTSSPAVLRHQRAPQAHEIAREVRQRAGEARQPIRARTAIRRWARTITEAVAPIAAASAPAPGRPRWRRSRARARAEQREPPADPR